MPAQPTPPPPSAAGRGAGVVQAVLASPLPPMLMVAAIVLGLAALHLTPREEEPQIIVPLADVMIAAPGLSAAQVERQVATPLERLLSQIDGVEYVYSASATGNAVVTVRFYVGEDREDSLLKIYSKLYSNTDRVPAAVRSWVVKPVEIDDVPIVMAALWSDDPARSSDHELRRLAEEVALQLQSVPETGRIEVTGGRPRAIRVELNPEALAARRTAPLEVAWAIDVSNRQLHAGEMLSRDRTVPVEAGRFIGDAQALRDLVVNVVDGVPVYLREVATVLDGPAEPESYTWLGFGPAAPEPRPGTYPMVALSVAKQKGANAVEVAAGVEARLAEVSRELFPPQVHYRILRDYGQTADQKVTDLITSLLVAVLTVVVFIGLFLGWRAALVVGLAIPVCYGATLAVDLLTGYTINRVTLFALILALGLLVDDPITGVDNIERYYRMGTHPPRRAVTLAIGEIRGALIMSSIAIVLAFLPMSFITGMMGPYMAPMALNVPVSVIASTFVAFLITPWLAWRLLRSDPPAPAAGREVRATPLYRVYARVVGPLVRSPRRGAAFLAAVGVLFAASLALPALRLVPLKLLPFDNKDEFQVVIDMPEGTSLERTRAVAREVAGYLRTVPEVREYAAFVGLASPMDFNALVRRYYLRRGGHVADLRVTLAPRAHRARQSHRVVLHIRAAIDRIAREHGANIKLVEVPPGPPVVSTIVAEIYGEPATPYAVLQQAALASAARLRREPLLADVDTSVEAARERQVFVTDKEKAALSGVATEDVTRTAALALGGTVAGWLQLPGEAEPLPIELRLPLARRSSPHDLESLHVKGRPGITKLRDAQGVKDAPQPLVQLGELGRFVAEPAEQTIYHKNLRRVAYVYADTAGRPPAGVVVDVAADLGAGGAADGPRPLAQRSWLGVGGGLPWTLPAGVSAVWNGEGEWHITLQVFRDLGIAFAAALVGIFAVLYLQSGSAVLAGIIMLAIPLTVIGIMPGFWLLNGIGERSVDGLPDPVLFTATAMIGMIALAGIVVRNSLILVEFVHLALRRGERLEEALVQAGAVRMRPVILTAGTTLLGNLVITLDPIFSGLAWAIIFGILASTLFTLGVVPVVYALVYARRPGHGLPAATETPQ